MTGGQMLAQKTVLIIGGTSGFGQEVARQAAAQGAVLRLVGRDAAKAEAVAQAFREGGAEARGYGCDATDPQAFEALLGALGQLDHLVSMVGGAMGGGFLSAPEAAIRDTVEGKLFANLRIARSAAPSLRPGGSMTFTAGAGGRPDNASGAILGNIGISTLVRGLGVELAPKLRANAVAPTWTPTPLWRSLPEAEVAAIRERFSGQIPLGRTGTVAEIAQAYLFVMTCGFITGQTIVVDGGLSLL